MNDPVEIKPKRGGWRAGSGRKFGVPNRRPPKTLAEQAGEHCPLAIEMLAAMTRDETAPHQARIEAATTLLRLSAGQPSTDAG